MNNIIKKALFLFILFVISLNLSAQGRFYKVQTSPTNTLYLGLNNPIQLIASTLINQGLKIALKTTNGVVATRNNLNYILPKREGEAILKVFQIKGKDTIPVGQQIFIVKPVYMPMVALNKQVLDSTISKSALMKEQHFRVLLPKCDYAVKFALTSCKLKFPNGRTYIAQQGVIGFNIKKEVRQLKAGTKLCFEDIQIIGFTGKETKLDGFCVTVTE
jgi:hypothetical protein